MSEYTFYKEVETSSSAYIARLQVSIKNPEEAISDHTLRFYIKCKTSTTYVPTPWFLKLWFDDTLYLNLEQHNLPDNNAGTFNTETGLVMSKGEWYRWGPEVNIRNVPNDGSLHLYKAEAGSLTGVPKRCPSITDSLVLQHRLINVERIPDKTLDLSYSYDIKTRTVSYHNNAPFEDSDLLIKRNHIKLDGSYESHTTVICSSEELPFEETISHDIVKITWSVSRVYPNGMSVEETGPTIDIGTGTAWVQVNGVWHRCIPWVKDEQGVWHKCIPWVQVNGTWKKTI